MKTKICKGCGKPFQQFIKIDKKSLNLSRRSYCLECSPLGEFLKNRNPIIDGKKKCKACLELKELTEFSDYVKGNYSRGTCRSCDVDRVLEATRNFKKKTVEHKGGACQICGYSKCMRSLIFHHKDPAVKSFSFGKKKNMKWEDALKELDKCVLVCSNCHGEIHDGITQSP